MALTTCPDCQNEISSEAFACPKCGRPTGKPQQLRKKKIVLVLSLWAGLVLAFLAIWIGLNQK